MGFPKKHAGRSGLPQPITGTLSKVRLSSEQEELSRQICNGLFLDMQDKPLSDVLVACFLTGMSMVIEAHKDD